MLLEVSHHRRFPMENQQQQQQHLQQQQQQHLQQQQQQQQRNEELSVTIRRVGVEDHINIIKLFQVKIWVIY